MTIYYQFCLRFRLKPNDDTLEIVCDPLDKHLIEEIRRIVASVFHQHPTAEFAGLAYHGSREMA